MTPTPVARFDLGQRAAIRSGYAGSGGREGRRAMRTRGKRLSRRSAPEERFIPLGSGFFLDRETVQVIAL
jgi:hypothetical protein